MASMPIKGKHAIRYSNNNHLTPSRDNGGKGESTLSRLGDVSVTALAFFGPGREHLLLTASEASTTVKLWDIRSRYTRNAMPLSTTAQPESHNKHRHFGISSLVLGSDESRLYALSRDNTVYVYPTSHLILGHAPELSSTSSTRNQRYGLHGRTGLGPMYGFRHPNFHATSFYVKAAIRSPHLDRPELLAVGSSDRCAVVFPTDESFLERQPRLQEKNSRELTHIPTSSPVLASSPLLSGRPSLRRVGSGLAPRMTDSIPIYEVGTPLVQGHQKEVTSLTWTSDGSLVSVSDDYTARRWVEDQATARELRLGGEGEGKRWNRGWAHVSADFDDDEED